MLLIHKYGALPLISGLLCIVVCLSVTGVLEEQKDEHSSILLDQLCPLPNDDCQSYCDSFLLHFQIYSLHIYLCLFVYGFGEIDVENITTHSLPY